MTEQWSPIPCWENLYEVSNEGRVRSLPRIDRLGRRFKGRVLKAAADKDGRLHVVLSVNAKETSKRIHALVAEAFIGPRPPGMEVCHNDGDPGNNRLSNLRYDDHSGNMRDRRLHGTDTNLRKETCPKGHPYDESNTIYFGPKRHRRCRICTKKRESSRLPGTRHPNLTEADVREIRIRAASGEKRKELAAAYGVGYDQIYRIISRHSWANVA